MELYDFEIAVLYIASYLSIIIVPTLLLFKIGEAIHDWIFLLLFPIYIALRMFSVL